MIPFITSTEAILWALSLPGSSILSVKVGRVKLLIGTYPRSHGSYQSHMQAVWHVYGNPLGANRELVEYVDSL